jgi:hypothetical protein
VQVNARVALQELADQRGLVGREGVDDHVERSRTNARTGVRQLT